jgi:hypothetical protein
MTMDLSATLSVMRQHGWRVAVHNDYSIGGRDMTFWLFTHPKTGRFVRGEGDSDAEAVSKAFQAASEITPFTAAIAA